MPLVLDAVTRRTGAVWTTEHEQVLAEAARRRTSEDGWEPRRADPPALPNRAEDDTPDPWLSRWLTTRRERFGAWAADTGRAQELDFSSASLVPLSQVIRERIPSEAALDAQIEDDLVQGAIWYLGEVARIHRAARWRYTSDPDGTSENPSVGRPWVAQDDDGGGRRSPRWSCGSRWRLTAMVCCWRGSRSLTEGCAPRSQSLGERSQPESAAAAVGAASRSARRSRVLLTQSFHQARNRAASRLRRD